MLNPGVYRVPGDISEALAERAIAEGAAAVEEEPLTVDRLPGSARKKQKLRRGRSLGRAPENKSQVD